MNPTESKPDLRRIGELAFVEVLQVLMAMPATVQNFPNHRDQEVSPDQMISEVPFTGERFFGVVRLHLPLAFVMHVNCTITGLDHPRTDSDTMLADPAGELANMVAGRVAARLAGEGFPCNLGTPKVTIGASDSAKPESGTDHVRSEFNCADYSVSLELLCRYANP
jgi:hypothetical protein